MGRLLLDGGEEVDVAEMQLGEMLIDKGIEVDATRGVGRDEGLGEKVQERAQVRPGHPTRDKRCHPPVPLNPSPTTCAHLAICTFSPAAHLQFAPNLHSTTTVVFLFSIIFDTALAFLTETHSSWKLTVKVS